MSKAEATAGQIGSNGGIRLDILAIDNTTRSQEWPIILIDQGSMQPLQIRGVIPYSGGYVEVDNGPARYLSRGPFDFSRIPRLILLGFVALIAAGAVLLYLDRLQKLLAWSRTRKGLAFLALVTVGVLGALIWLAAKSLAPANPEFINAADTGDIEKLRAIIGRGVNVNAKSEHGHTALQLAAEGGHVECVDLLLKSGADGNEPCEGGITALMLALRTDMPSKSELAIVQDFISHHVDLNARDDSGYDALMIAIINDNLDVAQLLVKGGSNVNGKDKEGTTQLMHASFEHRGTRMAQFLLRSGAKVNERSESGETALMVASGLGSMDMGYSGSHLDTMKVLLVAGADPNAKDVAGNTALMGAVRGPLGDGSAEECVRVLLAAHADPNAKDSGGKSVLAQAQQIGASPAVIRELKALGAN
ncbi:MAG: ankyrin repeat domain-containing protein [Fimbriimonas sp.]|nr:ankyrin repeat domain-containing protein [Fimbriimonas sp.]